MEESYTEIVVDEDGEEYIEEVIEDSVEFDEEIIEEEIIEESPRRARARHRPSALELQNQHQQLEVGKKLVGLGMYKEAIPILTKGYAYTEGIFGANDSKTLELLYMLATCYYQNYKSTEVNSDRIQAEKLLFNYMKESRIVHGHEDSHTLDCMGKLQQLYERQGKFDHSDLLYIYTSPQLNFKYEDIDTKPIFQLDGMESSNLKTVTNPFSIRIPIRRKLSDTDMDLTIANIEKNFFDREKKKEDDIDNILTCAETQERIAILNKELGISVKALIAFRRSLNLRKEYDEEDDEHETNGTYIKMLEKELDQKEYR